MKVRNTRTDGLLVSQLEKANSFFSRLRGLIGRKSLASGHGFLIPRCGNSIHTFFMKFPIDLVFINRKGFVKHIRHKVKPWRLVIAPILGSTDCIELPAGTAKAKGLKLGDRLRVEA